jgi:hypothetical protein
VARERARNGFTTVELLVAAVVGLLITGAALALCGVGNRAVATLTASHAAWSETRAAAALWAAEWRGAGYDPAGGSGARVERLEAGAMDLSADWNGNGLLLPTDGNPNERLAYAVGPGAWRRGVNGGPRLLSAWPDSARFSYRDGEGRELGPVPDPALARIAEARVRLPGARRPGGIEARWAAARRNP